MIRLIAALIALAWPAAALADQETLGQRMDAYMRARAELGQFSGAVWVGDRETVHLNDGYGLVSADGPVLDQDAAFQVASLTKPVTAAAVLLLRNDGRLALSDSVCRFVDPCPQAWAPVTIEHLLRHSSGVPDYEEALGLGGDDWRALVQQGPGAIIDWARPRPLDFAPGSDVAYSNTGYVLLAAVVAEASESPYPDFVRARVLTPARMAGAWLGPQGRQGVQAAGMTGRDEPSSVDLARGRPLDAGWLDAVRPSPIDAAQGDAALNASAADMAAFARWFLATFPEDLDLIRHDDIGAGQGLGWALTPGGGLAHNGVLPGFVSRITVDPESGLIVVVLANLDAARFDAVARDLAAIAQGQPYEAPRSHVIVELDAVSAEGLVGAYRLNQLDVSVTLENGALFLAAPGQFRAGLLPESADAFFTPFFEGMVTFQRDAAGRATGFTLAFRGQRHSATRADPSNAVISGS